MTDRRNERRVPLPGDPADPRGMHHLVRAFLASLEVRNFSKWTVYNHEKDLRYFMVWSAYRGITRPSEVTLPVLERYQRWLYHYRKSDGKPLTFHSQHKRLVSVRGLFRWLVRQHHILSNPASDIELPKREMRLPKHVLTASEAETILGSVDVSGHRGVRDRAILETLYSTGMRRGELISLKLFDVDVERGIVIVRHTKGRKDRAIPIGDRALAWIDRYLLEVRPRLAVEPDDGTLFLSTHTKPITRDRLTTLVRRYVEASGIGKAGACHLFRHTMATLMLENGADIRFIQMMLGHASLATTEVYTQVSIRKLKEIHRATHPARMERRSETPADDVGDDAHARADLFSSLAAEAAKEKSCGTE